MPKLVAPPPDRWETFVYRGRGFYRFPVQLGGGATIPYTVPRRIADRYQVRDVLARGGGGLVLVAADTRTGHEVLVKALAEYLAEPYDAREPVEEFVEELRRSRHHLQTERRILVQLRRRGCNAVPHPNDYVFDANPGLHGPHRAASGELWTFDDEALLGSEPYLVLQRMPGTPLRELLEGRYRSGMDERSALRLIDQVARVLGLLHTPFPMRNGQVWQFVYEDLKPGNVLVDDYGRATLLDFGGCQVMIDGILVLHGSYSRGYSAPECETAIGPLTPAADCYALGATLFHMVSGVHPQRLVTPDRGAPRPVPLELWRLLARRCSAGVINLLEKCVAWDPRARFQTMAEVRSAVARLLQST